MECNVKSREMDEWILLTEVKEVRSGPLCATWIACRRPQKAALDRAFLSHADPLPIAL